MYKCMIGTLYCGESDFTKCVESVRMQTYPVKHKIIANKPETKAHYLLYRAFKKSTFDYLIKLDADMVFMRPDAVEEMINRISSEKHLWRVTYLLQDFFTDSKINGLHIFNQRMKWNLKRLATPQLYPDRLHNLSSRAARTKHSIIIESPVAWHCKYANPEQAFRFGYRRFLKKGRSTCVATIKHAKQNPNNEVLRAACLGVYIAATEPKYPLEKLGAIFKLRRNKQIELSQAMQYAKALPKEK